MFTSTFDELKEESTLKMTDFRSRLKSSIYDESFLRIYLTAYYFRNKSSITADELFECV